MAQPPWADQFVGRDGELREVLAACRATTRGQGSLTVISGEAGIGKTRLCTEMQSRARRGGDSTGVTVIMARCWDHGGAPALWPWQPILDELCGPQAFRRLAGDAGLPNTEGDRFARFAAATEEIAEACRRQPTCLVVDDIHAADAGTLLLLRFLARSLHRINLALVLTRRSTEPAPDTIEARLIEEIEREATLIRLARFGVTETAQFLASHGVGVVDDDLLETVQRVTDGHPLFLRRITASGSPAPEVGLRSGLRDAIDDAVGGLAADHQRILRTVAVLGSTPSVAEAAAVADSPVAHVLDAVRAAEAAGLVVAEATSRFSFTHELVRTTLVEGLRPAERLDAHGRAFGVIAGDEGSPGADALIRRAHHALAAAPRSAADARLAVDACRIAAQSLVGSFAYEHADRLLTAAMELHEPHTIGAPPGQLVLEWAQAALLCGHLAEARDRFGRAVSVAEREEDPALLAEAVLGLGGYWLADTREPVERARIRGRQRAALDALPEDELSLRCRLTARLAADDFYVGGPIEPMYAALDAARSCGDPAALADALSFCHHALMSPEHTRERLALADELVQVAAEAGHGLMGLMGLCWRTLDLLDLGDPRAGRALADLRQRADTLACQAILYVVGVIDVMLLIRAGRLDDAEEMAYSVYEHGAQVGEVDAFTWYGAQFAIIRWLQGRTHELVELMDSIATSPTLLDTDFAYWAAGAAFANDVGNRDRARQTLDELCSRGLSRLPRSSTWLVGMMIVAELAAALEDTTAAREVYDLLAPFAELPIVPSLGIACFGSTQRSLGLMARTLGDHDRAVEHLQQAVTANQRLPNLPLVTLSQADLATTLLAGPDRGRDAEARHLLTEAAERAEAMGMDARASVWRTVLELDRPLQAPRSAARTAGSGVIRREGRGWHIAVDDRHVHVGNLVGLRYLVELLVRPGQAIPALTLAANTRRDALSRQDVLDEDARSAYVDRAQELAEELSEAESNADIGRAEKLRAELDVLVDQLRSATGLGGRPRSFAGPDERARTAVRKAIMRAIEAIDAADSTIGSLLRTTITTGRTCIYAPDPDHPVVWTSEI